MRILVFLLILVNLLFLAWTQGLLGSSSNADALRVQQQLLADQVTVVSRDEPPAVIAPPEPRAKVVEVKAVDVCLELSDIPIADVAQVEGMLAEKLPVFKSERTAVSGTSSYWVIIPPLTGKGEVDTKVAELKKLNISEFFVVQENGPNNRAISLGLYTSKAAATSQLESLRKKGVKSAKIVERIVKPTSASLEIRGPAAQADSLRQAIAEVLPEGKPVVCKTPTRATASETATGTAAAE